MSFLFRITVVAKGSGNHLIQQGVQRLKEEISKEQKRETAGDLAKK